MASPVDSARQGTNISTAATSHAINVGSPVSGTLLIVMVRFAAAPGTVTFTGYTQFAVDTSDASDDDTRLYYRWADGSEGLTDTLSTTNSVKLAAICWEITGAANPATMAPFASGLTIGTAANINPALGVGPPGVATLNYVNTTGTGFFFGQSSAVIQNAQSFVATGPLAQVALSLKKTGSPVDNLIVEIRTDSGGSPSSTVLASASIAGSALTTSYADYMFALSTALSASTTYWIVVRRSGAVDASNYYLTEASSLSVYSGGTYKYFDGATWNDGGGSDLSFSTYEPTAADFLFLTVIGLDSETATFTQPSGYTNLAQANSGTAGAVATNCMIAGASKQATAVVSDDPGAWTSSAPNAGVTAWTIAIPPPPPKQTSVAEISLASHGTPSARTNHSIKVRARTTSGSTGVLKAALYEGSTNRSGDLTSSALTNSLADLTLAIPDASAANITDYSNLSIRLWGYDSAGNALVFEVAGVYLELPTPAGPATYYGATAMAVTFGKAVAGVTSKKTSVAEISLASHGTPTARTNHRIRIRARTTSGSTGVIRAALYEGSTNRSGDLSSSVLTNSLAEYVLTIPDASAANIVDYSNLSIRLWGFDSAGNALVFEVANVYLELPVAGAGTYYGVVARPFTFVKDVTASRKTFSATVTALTFTKDVTGQRRTTSQIAVPFTFTKSVLGSRKTFSQIAAPFTFSRVVSGSRKTFSQIAAPFTFSRVVSGSRKTFSQIAAPFTLTISVLGSRKTVGQIAVSFTLPISVLGSRKTFSQIAAPFTFTKSVLGSRKTFSQIAAPFTFTKNVLGSRKTFSQIAAPFTFTISVLGSRKTFGQVVRPFTFVKDVSGKLGTFGQIVSPFTFTKSVSAFKQTFGQVVRPFTFVKDVSGRKTALGQIVRPFTFVKDVAARRTTFGQVAQSFTRFRHRGVGRRAGER